MKTSPSPRPAAVPAGWLRGLPPSAAAAMPAAVTAVPAAANAGFAWQAGCSVATDPASDLASGRRGVALSGHGIANAAPCRLLADPGGKVSAAPVLKATTASRATPSSSAGSIR